MLNSNSNPTFDLTIKISINSDVRLQIVENLKNKGIYILEDENKTINRILVNIIESEMCVNTNYIHLTEIIDNYFDKNEDEYLLDDYENGLFLSS